MVKYTLKKLYDEYNNEDELYKKNLIKTKILLIERKLTYMDIVNWINENTSFEVGFLRDNDVYTKFLENFNEKSFCEEREFINDFINGNLRDNSYYNNKDNLFYIDDPCVGYCLYNIYDIYNGLYKILYYILDDWGLYIKPEKYNSFLKLF